MEHIIYSDNNTFFEFPKYVDEFGNPVKRTKDKYPYSYDGFVTWSIDEEADDTVYSDRLLHWNYTKCRSLMNKHFKGDGDYYYNRSPEQIEAFLSEYMDKDIKLVRVMEYCNQSSGYPVWRFDYKINGK